MRKFLDYINNKITELENEIESTHDWEEISRLVGQQQAYEDMLEKLQEGGDQ